MASKLPEGLLELGMTADGVVPLVLVVKKILFVRGKVQVRGIVYFKQEGEYLELNSNYKKSMSRTRFNQYMDVLK